MIPISFRGNERTTVNSLYHILLDVKPRQHNKPSYVSTIKDINDWCNKNIVIDGKPYSFPQVIQADYDTLTKITGVLDSGAPFPIRYKDFIIDTLYTYRFPRAEFMDSLEVTVCPYCNRNFVNKADTRTMCDLDHFFSKDTYPVLAVSFYNLVPVCHPCNHSKGFQNISYSPYDKRYSTDELLTFDFNIKGADFLLNEKSIGIDIDDTEIIRENVNVLNLRDVYQIHVDIVQDCIKNATIFNPEYLSYLYYRYHDLFGSEEDLYRTIFGNYIEEKSYGKRPLSKMTSDIIKELFEIYYGIEL